jgi:hypothetical protein
MSAKSSTMVSMVRVWIETSAAEFSMDIILVLLVFVSLYRVLDRPIL